MRVAKPGTWVKKKALHLEARHRPFPGFAPAQDGAGSPTRFQFGQLPSRGRRAAIFLDRDGVINQRILGGFVTTWDEFHFIDGMPQVLGALSRLRVPIVVVSNQSGVGKGLLRRSALGQITERFVDALAGFGARVDAVYYCPHAPEDGCRCRKPRPGLLVEAARDWRLSLRASVLIGDCPRDIQAAQAAGCRGILLGANGPSEIPGELADVSAAFRTAGGDPDPAAIAPITNVENLTRKIANLLGRSVPVGGPGDHEPA